MATRKIKDAKDLSTNELIYFKGHAKATYMSDGTTVEDAINNIEVGNGVDLSDYATKEELSSKQDKLVSSTNIKTINGDSILGEGNIEIGSEQVQSDWNETDATSAAYIANKPDIYVDEFHSIIVDSAAMPNEIGLVSTGIIGRIGIKIGMDNITWYGFDGENGTTHTITSNGDGTKFLTDDGTYKEIPTKISDLENDSNFVSSDNLKTINGNSIVGSGNIVIEGGSGGSSEANVQAVEYDGSELFDDRPVRDIVDLNTGEKIYFTGHAKYITTTGGSLLEDALTEISNSSTIYKWDVEAVEYENPIDFAHMPQEILNYVYTKQGVVTINDGIPNINDDIITSFCIINDTIRVTKVYLDNNIQLYYKVTINTYPIGAYAEINHGTEDTIFTLIPNILHVWDEVASLTLTFGSETSGIVNEYLFQFTSGSEPTTLILPDSIKFNSDFTVEANKIYQISILNGLGTVMSWEFIPQLGGGGSD